MCQATKLRIGVSVVLAVLVSGCVSRETPGVSREAFKAAFLESCQKIGTIYEGHESSGFFYREQEGGNFTKSSVSLSEMEKWLVSCDINLESVNRVME